MVPDDNVETGTAPQSGRALSLADVVAYVWRRRWIMLALTAVSVAIGVATVALFSTYTSVGFFQFGGAIPDPRITDYTKALEKESPPGIPVSDHKRYAAVYLTRERFAEFVRSSNLADNPAAREISKSFGKMEEMLEPVHAFTRQDAKNVEQPKDANSNVIGLRITARSSSPALAQEMVSILGRYVVDSIVHTVFSNAIQAQYADVRTAAVLYDNMVLAQLKDLNELERKAQSLKEIMRRHPESSKLNLRQVVSVTPDSARFLSPLTLLVTAEVDTFEAGERIRNFKRQKAQSVLLMEYFERVQQLLGKSPSGEDILQGMERIREDVFGNKDMEDEAVREVYNTIKIANQRSTSVYLSKSRFIAGPTLPQDSNARPFFLVAALALVVGLICSFVVVFAMQWWAVNRAAIYGNR